MDPQELKLSSGHRAVLNHFVAACRADERVVAATLYSSYARGEADALSDLGLITTEKVDDDFVASREARRLLGEPSFLEAFWRTTSPMRTSAMRQAGFALFSFYRELVPTLARDHGITYPADLERVMSEYVRSLPLH